jgi:hypothetical protein
MQPSGRRRTPPDLYFQVKYNFLTACHGDLCRLLILPSF